jgi:hypothetical protein
VSEIRGLGVVFVHHQHMGIARYADLRQIDHIDVAAGRANRRSLCRIFGQCES